ncbi:MAG: hypothetical protein AAB458_00010 [Patescibacteria group bacterium]
MKYHQFQDRIEDQIQSLNMLIDEKILHGISYKAEAKRHKALIRWARRDRKQRSLFAKFASFTALF